MIAPDSLAACLQGKYCFGSSHVKRIGDVQMEPDEFLWEKRDRTCSSSLSMKLGLKIPIMQMLLNVLFIDKNHFIEKIKNKILTLRSVDL